MTPVKEIQTGITSVQRNRIPGCLRPLSGICPISDDASSSSSFNCAEKFRARRDGRTPDGVSIVALQYSVGRHHLFDCCIALVQFCHACAVSFVIEFREAQSFILWMFLCIRHARSASAKFTVSANSRRKRSREKRAALLMQAFLSKRSELSTNSCTAAQIASGVCSPK